MNITNSTYAGVVYLVIVALIAGPVIYRLVGNLLRHYRIRQHIKSTPGPLLGVIYPEKFGKKDNPEDTGR
jgi:hypothetical protein